jgi:hypothetical protein
MRRGMAEWLNLRLRRADECRERPPPRSTARGTASMRQERTRKGGSVLRGDLSATSLAELLKELSEAYATGCVYLQPTGSAAASLPPGDALVALRDGAVSNVVLPGNEDAVAARLIVTGRLTPAALDEARLAQETELPGWAIPDLLIHLGLADENLVCTLVLEQALADLSVLCAWREGTWRFRRRERWGPSLPTPLPVAELLTAVDARHAEWQELLPVIGGADAVVSLAAQPDEAGPDGGDVSLDREGYTMLCAVDGVRTIAELGEAVGYTLLDAGRAVAALIDAGLVQVTRTADDEGARSLTESAGADADHGDAAGTSDRGLDAIAAAFAAPLELSELGQIAAPWQQPRTGTGESLAEALSRVSVALTDSMSLSSTRESDVAEPPVVESLDVNDFPAVDETPEVDGTPEPDVRPEAEAEVQPEVQAEVQPEVQAEVQAEAEVEPDIALVELSALAQPADEPAEESAPASQPAPKPEATRAAEPEQAVEPSAPAGYVAMPRSDTQLTDTAALMRELSSLGTEQKASNPVPTISRPATSGTGAHARKRKGLFGRS